MIDCQGNWGDIRTGDRAAASRYIEARLTKFALEVAFNSQTTEWQLSYDGRKREPVDLPMKFPLLLVQGVEGIAVGLSTKILPHNFCELINASIKILNDRPFEIYPDFQTGGSIDVSDYAKGKRGGKVKVRAHVEIVDKKTLKVTELPYGVTTGQLIDSIVKANEKGKIKIKKVTDNTAEHVEIMIDLATGVSPELTLDALYAFTNCEISISPNACVIIEDTPHFLTVNEILKTSTLRTKDFLGQELNIKKEELLEKWLFASLEKVFIENRVYREIEECETWEAVLETIKVEMAKYIQEPSRAARNPSKLQLTRILNTEDYVRLTEIRIKKISKFNTFKADEHLKSLKEEIDQVQYDLDHLNDFAIQYFEKLLSKYGKGKERKTKIAAFESIQASRVVVKNTKLYVNRKEGFVGMGLKKDEFICDCSDIDDILVFKKDGKFSVHRIADKTFVGKNILHVAVWKKGDERTTYNLIYVDGSNGRSMAKRFQIQAITRDRDYSVISEAKGSRMEYFTVNPNGEGEIVSVQLTQGCSAKKKIFEYDFGGLAIKGKTSKGNVVTKYPVRKISLKEKGKSTLGATKLWMDKVTGRLNKDKRGLFLGDFDTGDSILSFFKEGSYEQFEFKVGKKIDLDNLLFIIKHDPTRIYSAVYYEGEKESTYVKRFKIETSTFDQKFTYITDHSKSKLLHVSSSPNPQITYKMRVKGKYLEGEINLSEFIEPKGWKVMGNRLSNHKLTAIQEIVLPDSQNETPTNEN